MGQAAKLRVEVKSIEGQISVLERQEAKRPEMLKKLTEEVSKAEKEFKEAGEDFHAAEEKWKKLAKGKDKTATSKAETEKTKAERLYESARQRWVGLAKTLKEAQKPSDTASELEELKKELLAKQHEYEKVYAANLRAYTEKKTALMQAFKSAEEPFNKWHADAQKAALAGDLAAKGALAAKSPVEAKEYVAKAEKLPDIIAGILKSAEKKAQELLELFDPHRTGEKPDEYDLLPQDVGKYSKVFGVVDGVRKQYGGFVEDIRSAKAQVETAVQQARVALLSESERLSEFSKIAQVIANDAENKYKQVVGSVSLQGLVGKDLAGQMSMWKQQVDDSKASEEQKQKAINVAKTRMGQVETNEKVMKNGFAALRQSVEKGFARIPENLRTGSPLIRTMVQKAHDVVKQADEYEKTWAEERQKGETVYKQFAA